MLLVLIRIIMEFILSSGPYGLVGVSAKPGNILPNQMLLRITKSHINLHKKQNNMLNNYLDCKDIGKQCELQTLVKQSEKIIGNIL